MNEKVLAVIAYILSPVGAIIALLFGRGKAFCRHHARRSLELFGFVAVLFVAWLVTAHILTLIPYVGFPIGILLFGLVLAAFLFALVLAVIGIIKAIKGEEVIFPMVSARMIALEPLWKRLGLTAEQK
jgi:uncharacterized membrane protein